MPVVITVLLADHCRIAKLQFPLLLSVYVLAFSILYSLSHPKDNGDLFGIDLFHVNLKNCKAVAHKKSGPIVVETGKRGLRTRRTD